MSMFRLNDRETADRIVRALKSMRLNVCLMHVCGTHQDTLVRYGLDSLLRDCGVTVRQGPGCPVCVTTMKEYEEAATLAKEGIAVATFGDASRVPGQHGSLLDLRAEGCNVRIVYGIEDAVKIAEGTEKKVVFLGVGFETTAPSTAVMVLKGLPKNFSILNCHRYVPPALNALLGMGEVKLHGLIEPGHVSTIIGIKPYEEISKRYKIPQVIAGFEPLDMLMAVYMLACQIKNQEAKVENEYSRVVRYDGNVKALDALDRVFEPFDIDWRGFPIISESGMKLRKKYNGSDARKVYADELKDVAQNMFEDRTDCRCGEVLRGLIDSTDCPLFGKGCTPTHPTGPCMVSMEGSCNIEFKYGTQRKDKPTHTGHL
ncbi:MAG: hydrogenase formation protein HypD [Candidatus Bathyarchaeota archaeon]